MKIPISIVDAFASKPFSGNPAAVCITEKPLDEGLMQSIAAEMNLSETAFLYPKDQGYHLRWFTPLAEVKLCGHATLASAHLLWESGKETSPRIQFHTLSGLLTAMKNDEFIELDFPVEVVEPSEVPLTLLEALNVTPIFSGKTATRYFLEISSADELRQLEVDFGKLATQTPGRVIVTCRSDNSRYDFISRYFAPGIGVPEDPVTGSAHCALAHYWSKKLGKNEFFAYQASRRGGEMKVVLSGERVLLYGQALTVLSGSLAL